jgi:hypothetical protein
MRRLLVTAFLGGVTALSSCSDHQRDSSTPAAANAAYGPETQPLFTNSCVEGFDNNKSGAELPNSASTNITWRRREGLDFGYFLSDGVFGVDMKLVRLKAKDWNRLKASDLLLRLEAAGKTNQPKCYLDHSAGPSVYGFQTRAGTVGLLQVLSFTDNPHAPKYKYKLMQTGSSPNPQGGANGRQPFSSETNRTSAAAASRRSP